MKYRTHFRWYMEVSQLDECVEVASDGLQIGANGFEAFDDFDVAVDISAFVALNHVACSLKGHASFFHKVIDETNLLDVGFGVLADASSCLLGLDVGKFLFPIAKQGFCYVEHACHFADAVEHLEVFVFIESHKFWFYPFFGMFLSISSVKS